jgi:hypothetical protein
MIKSGQGGGDGGGTASAPNTITKGSSRNPFDVDSLILLGKEGFFLSSTGNAASIIAIDSKIEQAMDLVKTHLMFAVREEVEILRAKIVELDNTIAQLQSENDILRQHVPQEILQNLDGGPSPSPIPSSTVTSATGSTTNAAVVAQ